MGNKQGTPLGAEVTEDALSKAPVAINGMSPMGAAAKEKMSRGGELWRSTSCFVFSPFMRFYDDSLDIF